LMARENRVSFVVLRCSKGILSFQSLQLPARGHWSTWPAFASGQTVLKNHKPCFVDDIIRVALLTIPKPRYLKQLESYLRKELQSLDLPENCSQELKLQKSRHLWVVLDKWVCSSR
uniref:Uncharacterized protein n=1 Tax=Bubo bubo TaxID=30461 RepID=A0A8C0EPI4_BUBBB